MTKVVVQRHISGGLFIENSVKNLQECFNGSWLSKTYFRWINGRKIYRKLRELCDGGRPLKTCFRWISCWKISWKVPGDFRWRTTVGISLSMDVFTGNLSERSS